MKRRVLSLLRAYRDYRQLQPAACRFIPTCTAYSIEAVEAYGLTRGGWMSLRRVCRCHPLGGHGYDPVIKPAVTPAIATAATELTEHHA